MIQVTDAELAALSYEDSIKLLQLLEKQEEYYKYNAIDLLFPEEGPLSIQKYPKHIEFFAAGGLYKHRLILASNRTGKSLLSCYEIACHTTGIYPKFWNELGGHRMSKPRDWIIAGESHELLRKSIIKTLLGNLGQYGTGLIRKSCLDVESLKDAKRAETVIKSIRVKHVSGQYCNINFLTYEMGRIAFQAFEANVLFDEEPTDEIWAEASMRTMTYGKDAMTITNFTPMKGETPLLNNFMEGHPYVTGPISKTKHITHLTWDDAPHLSEEDKADELKNIPVYMRDARTKGLPMIGEGAIYPIKEELLITNPLPFSIPDDWKRWFALDFGWDDPTAISWYAQDPNTGITYQYAEHYLSEAPVSTHAKKIYEMNDLAGFPIPGVCDPSGGHKNGEDGRNYRRMYEDQFKIVMQSAKNAQMSGHAKVFQEMVDGKFKVYSTCVNAIKEWRSYAMKKGKPHGEDHLMDTWKYGIVSGPDVAMSKKDWDAKQAEQEEQELESRRIYSEDSWMSQ